MLLDKNGDMIQTFSYDDLADEVTIRTSQNVKPYLEENKRLQTENPYFQSRSAKRIASIPNHVTYKWLQEDGVYWPRLPKHEKRKYLARKLNDPDYRYLRTSEGRF